MVVDLDMSFMFNVLFGEVTYLENALTYRKYDLECKLLPESHLLLGFRGYFCFGVVCSSDLIAPWNFRSM